MADPSQLPDYSEAGGKWNVDPMLLRAIAKVESGESTYDKQGNLVTSPAGAAGWMQFMPETAKQYGVDVKDSRSSIMGAAHYMSDLLDRTKGDLPGALALYNGSFGDRSQTYAKQILANYQQLQQQERQAQREAGVTSPEQPTPGVIEVGTRPPPPPALNVTGRPGTAVPPSDFEGVLTGKGPPPAAAAPPAAAPANDFAAVLGGEPAVAAAPAPAAPAAPRQAAPIQPPAPAMRMPAPAAPTPALAAAPPAPAAPAAPTAPPAPPVPAAAAAAEPPSWYQRNIGAPVQAMMRPDLPQPPQNALLGIPTLQSLGAGTVQGVRDVAQTLTNAGQYVNARVPALAALDRYMGYPDQSTLPAQTAAFQQQYGSDIPAAIGRLGGEIGTTMPVSWLAAPVGAAATAIPAIGRVAGPAIAGAVGGGGQNLLVSGGTGQTPLNALATGAAGGAALGGLFGVGSRLFSGAGSEIAALGRRLGIRTSAGQRAGQGSVAQRIEDTAAVVPGSGASVFAAQQRGDIAALLRRELGEPAGTRITSTDLEGALRRVGHDIENAAGRITVTARPGDMRFPQALDDAFQEATRFSPNVAGPWTRAVIEDLYSIMRSANGTIPGDDFARLIRANSILSRGTRSADDGIRTAANAIREALFDAANNSPHAPREALADLARARYQWKVGKTIEPAIENTVGGTEEMSLARLAQSIRNNRHIDTLADEPLPNLMRLINSTKGLASSGTAERLWWQNALGLGGIGLGGGGALGLLSHPQSLEAGIGTVGIPYLASALASRLSRFGPSLGSVPVEAGRQVFNPLVPRMLGPAVGGQLTGQQR